MSRDKVQQQVLHLCTLVQDKQLHEAAKVLATINAEEIIESSDLTFSFISIEQTAIRLLKDRLEKEGYSGEFIHQISLFNHRLAILNTEDTQLIHHQSELLLDKDVLACFIVIIDFLLVKGTVHHHPFIRYLCIWLESIAHFIHRHDQLFTDILEALRRSVLSCVLSNWFSQYINPSGEADTPARVFFIRTCSFLTGIFQLSSKNTFQTNQSAQIVRNYFQQIQTIEQDSVCLTGIGLLITNSYKYDVFRNDDAYFTLLLRFLQSDFIRNNLQSTWTNDSTILADTLMVQLMNSMNDPIIRRCLQENHAVDTIYLYMDVEYDQLRFQSCMLLGELLDDQTIKQLQISNEKLIDLYFQSIESAYKSPTKSFKQIPIDMFFKALAAFVHNTAIPMVINKSSKYFEYLISMSDDYDIVYDILWTLSFEKNFHEKYRAQGDFLDRLRMFVDQPEKDAAEGILWNIFNHDQVMLLPDRPSTPTPNK